MNVFILEVFIDSFTIQEGLRKIFKSAKLSRMKLGSKCGTLFMICNRQLQEMKNKVALVIFLMGMKKWKG